MFYKVDMFFLILPVMPKCHSSEDHACVQVESLKGLANFCEDWVEQLHQLWLKNKRRMNTIRYRDRKHELYTQFGEGKWKLKCTEDKQGSKQETEAGTTAF
jgi:hypothetical protein